MREDVWAELPLHLMTISCQDERRSGEEDERPQTEDRRSSPALSFAFHSPFSVFNWSRSGTEWNLFMRPNGSTARWLCFIGLDRCWNPKPDVAHVEKRITMAAHQASIKDFIKTNKVLFGWNLLADIEGTLRDTERFKTALKAHQQTFMRLTRVYLVTS